MSHPAMDIWREALKEWRDEMRNKEPLECPMCQEITLTYVTTTDHPPFISTYECICGCIMCVHERRKVSTVTRGWGNNIIQTTHCPNCGEELELEKQNWWAQQDQDDEWIEENV